MLPCVCAQQKCVEMKRSIVPPGFEISSHPCFRTYHAPYRVLRDVTSREVRLQEGEEQEEEKRGNGEDEPCPICLCLPMDQPITLLLCGHSFCDVCAMHWFNVKLNCPICKRRAGYFLRGKHEESLKIYEVQGECELLEELDESQIDCCIKKHRARGLVGNTQRLGKSRRRGAKWEGNGQGEGHSHGGRKQQQDEGEKEEEEVQTCFHVTMPCKDGTEVGRITSELHKGAFLEFDILYGRSPDVDHRYVASTSSDDTLKPKSALIEIIHVYVPKKMRGQGIAEKLTKRGLEIATLFGCKVRPTCSYVKDTFFGKKFPEISESMCEDVN